MNLTQGPMLDCKPGPRPDLFTHVMSLTVLMTSGDIRLGSVDSHLWMRLRKRMARTINHPPPCNSFTI